ncbi:MAG: hypothetical protein V4736_03765 [Bdellovibrionota bacterium]
MKNLLGLLLVCCVIPLSNASAASVPAWTAKGNCAEFTPSGVYIAPLNIETCEVEGKFRVSWTDRGNCAVFTPSGIYVRPLRTESCETPGNYRVSWTKKGNCAIFTPGGIYVRPLFLDDCREQ